MKARIAVCLALAAVISGYTVCKTGAQSTNTEAVTTVPVAKEKVVVVVIKTSMGDIKAELFDQKAPETVKNFLSYVDDKFYNETIFHRVIPGFMVQGGGFTGKLEQKAMRPPVVNEAGNGLKNSRGTLAMARTPEINSATAQFFINVADNAFLNHKDASIGGFGYCVFGKVTEGMDVVDRIAATPTASRGPHEAVPVENIVIKSITRQ